MQISVFVVIDDDWDTSLHNQMHICTYRFTFTTDQRILLSFLYAAILISTY